MQLAKVVIKGTGLGIALILTCGGFSTGASLSVTSESKDEEIISSVPKEDEPEFPISTIHWEMDMNTVPLGTFDEVEAVMSDSKIEAEKENETEDDSQDEGPRSYYTDLDEDPLSYYSEVPEPDWSVIPLDQSLVEEVLYQSAENKVDPCVVIALMQSESGFHTDVTSSAGCYGLMQLHPLYYPEDMTNPYKNIQYGVETIGKNLVTTDGNYVYALSMYANGHIGTNFTYQYDVMTRAEEWRTKLQEANIL